MYICAKKTLRAKIRLSDFNNFMLDFRNAYMVLLMYNCICNDGIARHIYLAYTKVYLTEDTAKKYCFQKAL